MTKTNASHIEENRMSQQTSQHGESNTDEDTILEVKDASVTFDMDRGTSRVLNDASLDIKKNEILGVVGESGSGKSMFASALLNAVVEPGTLSGEIIYHPEDGAPVDIANASHDVMKQYRWKEISMVFQGAMSSFNPTQKIKTHFTETIKAHNYDLQSGMAHARDLLRDLHLDPDRVLDAYPYELSGGMQQRALIALSLVLKPRVLVMDEPTAALDLLMQRSILGLLENLQEEYDLTVVFITHDLPLVAGLADRIGVMYAFEMAEVGPADQVISDPAHPYTRNLLNAVPNLQTPLDEMQPIEGSSPDPVGDHTGCQYAERCPLATQECHTTDPPFVQTAGGHEVACFHWEQAREEIPLAVGDGRDSSKGPEIEGKQSADPVVSMDDLDVHFENEGGILSQLRGESETVYAVNDIDLDIYQNDVVALVGESGCGKTTLGKAAIGVQRPTDGTLSYRGQDVWETRDNGASSDDVPFSEIRQSLQIIHQDPGSSLNPNNTVRQTLAEPLKQAQPELSFKDRRERILGMLEYVGLTPPRDYAERYPHQLSGGEKQRVALIRALFMNPDLILADEAVSALDVSLRVEMMDLMLELQDRFNTSYLFISHNLENARYLAGKVDGRIAVMYLGNIVEVGPAEQMINDPKHPYTKILRWSTTDVDPDEEAADPPIRGIDIPDPVDPPSGCPFQTRCPKAREHCTEEQPPLAADDDHAVACFRERDADHPYWESDPVEDVDLDNDIFGPDLPPDARSTADGASSNEPADD